MRIIKAARGRITSPFGAVNVPGANVSRHLGMDLGHGDMTPADLEVVAPASGIVTAVGLQGTYGLRVVIQHGGGWSSLLAHLAAADVAVGDQVTQGQPLATMGSSGGDWPVHLHQELRLDGVPVNPEDHLTAAAPAGVEAHLIERNNTMRTAIVSAPNGVVVMLQPGRRRDFANPAEYEAMRAVVAKGRASGSTDLMPLPELAKVQRVTWAEHAAYCAYLGAPLK